jgi:hypothetical protein
MISVAVQDIEYIESGGPVVMDIFWAVVDLAIIPRFHLINAVRLVPDVEVSSLQEVIHLTFGESVV